MASADNHLPHQAKSVSTSDSANLIGGSQNGQGKPHGPWTVLQSSTKYQDPWLLVVRDEVVRPDGLPGSYCVVHLKHGVCVIALDESGTIHLTKEFHYGVGRTTIEGASGGREAEEPALETAQRELKEELGISAEIWIDLGVTDPFTANVVSPTQMYLAMNLTFGETELEGTEQIERYSIPFHEAVRMVLESEITHSPSCLAILKAQHHLSQQAAGNP